MVHWEKSRRRVWRSETEVVRVWASATAAATRWKQKSRANLADPTGAPRRRQPSVSSTGMGGSVGLVALEME
eukprot:scaffold21724_cov89-Skeletonema_marinoi.AAC.1